MMLPLLILAMTQAPSDATTRPDPATLGPKVGEPLPAFSLVDQSGRSRDFASLVGPKGLVLVVFRSADW
jgi:cytochrome oxidase Cu insertion factor (SCO1/SenC/PrrC family)